MNLLTVSWLGTLCTDPPMCYISVRPERYSYEIIKETGEFVINLTTADIAHATDWCGVKSGRDFDKFKESKLTPMAASIVKCPVVAESPISIECKVREIKPLGTHDMFIADVVNILADDRYIDPRNGSFQSGRFGHHRLLARDLLLAGKTDWQIRLERDEGKNEADFLSDK